MWDFLFGKNKDQIDSEYSKAIKDTKQSMADSVYQQHYNKALYDANKDYFDSVGVKDPSASYWNDNGQITNALNDTVNQYSKYLNDLSKEREDVARQNKYNIYGNGLIGNLLNPFHQTGTSIQDLVTSGTKEWQNGNRDLASDLGSAAEVALTLLTLGAGSGASAGAKTLAKTIGKGALLGAGYGATGALRDMGSRDFNLGQLALSTGIGAAVGGGTAGLGYGIGKIGDKYASRAQNTRTLQDLYKQYQNSGAISTKALGDGAGGASAVTAQQSPAVEWLLNRDDLAKTRTGQVVQGIKDTISYNKMMGNSPLGKVQNIASKVGNSKVGTNVSKILKTKTGKVAAGLGGGLLLSQLMNGGNSNVDNYDNEEIYNYITRGGQ